MRRGPAYTWIAITAEEAEIWGVHCDKCKRRYAEAEEVLADRDAERYFCNEACVEAYEEDRAEAAYDRRYEGEGPTTATEIGERLAGYLRGRK